MRSAWKAFALPTTRPFLFPNVWRAAYSVTDLPIVLSLYGTRFHHPLNLCGHYGSTFRRATLYVDLPGAWVEGRLPRVWCQSLGTKTIVVPPPNGAALPSTLGTKGDGNKNPQRKDYIIIAIRT